MAASSLPPDRNTDRVSTPGDEEALQDVTEPATVTTRARALPAQLTRLVGREEITAQVGELLRGADTRLVTLVGGMGVGKTALALRIAHAARQADEALAVRWVSVASVARDADPDAVDDTLDRALAQALAVRASGDRGAWESVQAYFHADDVAEDGARTLLVLDQCDHLLAAVGALVEDLLDLTSDAPARLAILCTSREILGRRGEHIRQVPPLRYPHRDTDDLDQDYSAITLFEDRAAAMGRPTPAADRPVIAQIVRAVDGHPQLIEAMVTLLFVNMTLAQIAARIRPAPEGTGRLPIPSEMLDDPPHAAHTRSGRRHGRTGRPVDIVTVGARRALDTSYAVCTDQEQRALQRLSVLDGGFDIATATTLCGGDGVNPDEVASLVAALARRSFLESDTSRGERPRYYIPQGIRWYGLEKLRERNRDEEPRLRRKHVEHYAALAQQWAGEWLGPREQVILDQAWTELPNFRTAMRVAFADPQRAPQGLMIAIGLCRLRAWLVWGCLAEGTQWLLTGLAATDNAINAAHPARVLALAMAGWLASCQGRIEQAAHLARECTQALGGSPAPPAVTFCGGAQKFLGDRDASCVQDFARASAQYAAQGDPQGQATADLFAGLAAALLGTDDTADQALHYTEVCHVRAQAAGAPGHLSWAHLAQAMAQTWFGDLPTAITLTRTALHTQARMGDRWGTVWAIHLLVWALAHQLATHRAEHPNHDTRPDRELAMQLAKACGATTTLREATNIRFPGTGPLRDRHTHAVYLIIDALDEPVFATLEAEGRALNYEQAVHLGMSLHDPYQPHEQPTDSAPVSPALLSRWSHLSRRQQEVVKLVAHEIPSTEIGIRLGIREGTVNTHVDRALAKFGWPIDRRRFVDIRHVIDRLPLHPRRTTSRTTHAAQYITPSAH